MEAPLPASVPAPEDRPQYETNSVNNDNDSDPVKAAEQEAEVEVGSSGGEVAEEEGGDYTTTQSPRNRPNEATRADDGDEKGKDEDEEDEAGEEAVEEEVREEKRKATAEETAELLRACETRDKAAVFELTRRSVRADAQDPLDARTPLHAAVTAGSADLLILLLSSCPVSCGGVEIDVNKQNRGGATPLHDAVQFASEDIVDILLTSAPGLDVNVGDKMGATPLILAAHRGREEIVARLIHHEANVNAYTVIGTTALHSAAEQGHVGIVALLLEKDAEVNRQDSAGFTPLALAVQADNLEMVALLVRSGASMTLLDQFGRTPLELSVSAEVRELLRECLDYERSKQLVSFARKSVVLATSDSEPLCVDFLPLEPSTLIGDAERARLGICCCPGRNKKRHRRDIFKDISVLTAVETNVLVTLVREVELQRMGATQLFTRSKDVGIESVWAPITDKWIPESMRILVDLVELLLTRLREDKVIVVHCNGGKGRSGMVVVSVLVALGMKPGDAIDLVRAARPGTIRNPAQVFYVKLFAQTWHQRHSPGPLRLNPPPLPPKLGGSRSSGRDKPHHDHHRHHHGRHHDQGEVREERDESDEDEEREKEEGERKREGKTEKAGGLARFSKSLGASLRRFKHEDS